MFSAISFSRGPKSAIRRRGARFAAAVAVLAVVALAAALGGPARARDSGALWIVVHELCVRDMALTGHPAPCAEVDLSGGEEKGWSILKDIRGRTQYLLIPTRRVGGVEDPQIGTPALPNYWTPAWTARKLIFERVGKEMPRDAIGLAINSAHARTQDQLHIHIDCVRPDVRDALLRHEAGVGAQWATLPVPLAGQIYRARRIYGSDPSPDPFELVLADARAAGVPMAQETVAVIGARFRDGKEGFIVLANHAGAGARAHSEDLLDHSCALANR